MQNRDKKAFDELEKLLLSKKEVNPEAYKMIEEQFSAYSYLQSLVVMRQEGSL
tara:strand:- start:1784 stop:1942 length:159 start_codon:yes stop_codon:yes gene_type:complete